MAKESRVLFTCLTKVRWLPVNGIFVASALNDSLSGLDHSGRTQTVVSPGDKSRREEGTGGLNEAGNAL